jgi:hypothetical protein
MPTGAGRHNKVTFTCLVVGTLSDIASKGSESACRSGATSSAACSSAVNTPQSTWKLLGAGSVGSQALTGIPVVSRLRNHRELESVSRVWPFELPVPNPPAGQPAIVHAEIWPSYIEVREVQGQVKDQTQVTRLAMRFREEDQSGTLRDLFAAASASDASSEEGWIVGVVA